MCYIEIEINEMEDRIHKNKNVIKNKTDRNYIFAESCQVK